MSCDVLKDLPCQLGGCVSRDLRACLKGISVSFGDELVNKENRKGEGCVRVAKNRPISRPAIIPVTRFNYLEQERLPKKVYGQLGTQALLIQQHVIHLFCI